MQPQEKYYIIFKNIFGWQEALAPLIFLDKHSWYLFYNLCNFQSFNRRGMWSNKAPGTLKTS